MKTPYRIVLADNHPDSSAELRAALETQPDLTLAASVTCASCSFTAVSQEKPDLVLLSLSMSGHRILQLVNDLVVLHADLKLLIVSSHEQMLESARVLRAGAHGCVTTTSSTAAKLSAMRQVLAGNHSFSSNSPSALHLPASCLAMA